MDATHKLKTDLQIAKMKWIVIWKKVHFFIKCSSMHAINNQSTQITKKSLRLPFGLRCLSPTYPPITPSYRVPVRQATISLSLLSPCTSWHKPWESLLGWLVTTSQWTFTTEHWHARYTKYNEVRKNFRTSLCKTHLTRDGFCCII